MRLCNVAADRQNSPGKISPKNGEAGLRTEKLDLPFIFIIILYTAE